MPCVEVDGREFAVEVEHAAGGSVSFVLGGPPSGSARGAVALPPPFRPELDQPRLSLVVRSLLSHDYLLTKKLHRGGKLRFPLAAAAPQRTRRLEHLVSLGQEAAVSPTPSERVLPWILPKACCAELYPFQRTGVDWLLSSSGRLLADDMGLGKTVQTIFGVRHGFSELLFTRVLVVCPKSLALNWLAEFQKWAPELITLAVSPPSRTAQAIWSKASANAHVLITNYEQLRETNASVAGHSFSLVVADEAHRLRNATSQVVQGFKLVRRERLWALTGTPIERDLKDLATLMSLIDDRRFSFADADTANAALREKAKPYILRRTKASVLSDLPEVVLRVEPLELSEPQKQTYRTVQAGRGCNGEQLINPLHKLGELRRVCDYDPISRTSVKLERIHEELLEIKAAGEKAIVFSYVLEPLQALLEMTRKSIRAIVLHGQLNEGERDEVVKRFRYDPEVTALYASSKVASEGLTLVEANHVFFINRWWNPSSNAQARDRVNRIGQKRCVFIHEYMCVGTIEESIQRLLKSKGDMYDAVIGRIDDTLLGDPNIKAHLDDKPSP